MRIELNGQGMEIADSATIAMLIKELRLPDRGVAVAVNQKMIPQTEWADQALIENDKVLIIRAACGG